MSALEKEALLGKDEFKNFRLLGLVHGGLSGMFAITGLAYFCTIVALAGTDTNAPNMALVVLASLSICVALAGTAVVALKFRSTNTRIKSITAVFVGQTILNLLLALLVTALGSASIPIAIETTAHTAVVVVPVLFLLFGVLTFATGILSLFAVFFRFPQTQKRKIPPKAYKVFTVSKTRRRTPSPPSLDGGSHDAGEEAAEAVSHEPERARADSRRDGEDGNGAPGSSRTDTNGGRHRESASAEKTSARRMTEGSKGKATVAKKDVPPAATSFQRQKETDSEGQLRNENGSDDIALRRNVPGRMLSHDERLFITVDAPPIRGLKRSLQPTTEKRASESEPAPRQPSLHMDE